MNAALQDVSRETLERLRIFETLVRKWTPKINLVSRGDRGIIWDRHIADSVQFFHVAPSNVRHWLDMGSGGGFPGIVVAILTEADDTPADVTMIESDARKAAFLRTALRETGARGTVINGRIEEVPPVGADVISARALAALPELLGLAHGHMAPGATCVFAKGGKWRSELAAAKTKWRFQHRVATSNLDPDGVILSIKDLSRAR